MELETTSGVLLSLERYEELMLMQEELQTYRVKITVVHYVHEVAVTCNARDPVGRALLETIRAWVPGEFYLRDRHGTWLEDCRTFLDLGIKDGDRLFVSSRPRPPEEER